MQISFSPNTNFKAKFIKKEPIFKLSNNSNEYGESAVSFVEIETEKPADIKALQESAKLWGTRGYFSQDIADSAADMHELYKKNVINPAVKFYVATLQDNEYEKLKPEYILGMTETRRLKPNHLEIICLQVNPNLMHLTNRLTKYKGIGRSIIRALKAQKENKVISLTSMYSAANFYEKLGFKLTNPQQLVYMWKRFKTKH